MSLPNSPTKYLRQKIDTGHTETVLSETWSQKLLETNSHNSTVVGIGSQSEFKALYAESFSFTCQGNAFTLNNIDILPCLYGAPDGVEVLFGYDLLWGKDWIIENGTLTFT